MSKIKSGDTLILNLGVKQIKEGLQYVGKISISDFKCNYKFSPVLKITKQNVSFLQKVTMFQIKKIFCPIELYTNIDIKPLLLTDEEYKFFFNVIYPNVVRTHFNVEIQKYNENYRVKKDCCFKDSKGSIGEPLEMITIPQRIFSYKIIISKIPSTILVFAHGANTYKNKKI